jgi:ssDNA-specific exonuclease RecJ
MDEGILIGLPISRITAEIFIKQTDQEQSCNPNEHKFETYYSLLLQVHALPLHQKTKTTLRQTQSQQQ